MKRQLLGDAESEGRSRAQEANITLSSVQVYFGFTHCPDICPEELDKMAIMIDKVKETSGNVMRPIFITCDPARDTPVVMKRYLREFHPDIIGLTGTWEDIKSVCKAYRVYFSTPADVKPGQDYLVDHSIYFYLMGKFRCCEACSALLENIVQSIQNQTDPLVRNMG